MPVISLLHAKGGVGKTTSTVWLAAAAHYSGLTNSRVHIIDADINQGTLSSWHEVAEDAHADNPNLPFVDVTLHTATTTKSCGPLRKSPTKTSLSSTAHPASTP